MCLVRHSSGYENGQFILFRWIYTHKACEYIIWYFIFFSVQHNHHHISDLFFFPVLYCSTSFSFIHFFLLSAFICIILFDIIMFFSCHERNSFLCLYLETLLNIVPSEFRILHIQGENLSLYPKKLN